MKYKTIVGTISILAGIMVLSTYIIVGRFPIRSLRVTKGLISDRILIYGDSLHTSAVDVIETYDLAEKFLLENIELLNSYISEREYADKLNAGKKKLKKRERAILSQLVKIIEGKDINACLEIIDNNLKSTAKVNLDVNGVLCELDSYCQRLRILGSEVINIVDVMLVVDDCGEICRLIVKEKRKI